jgi:alkylation response protein AidB-like acyl-CoA dehydrogenase
VDFALTPAQRLLVDDVTEFARQELSAGATHNDRTAEFDRKAWRRCAEHGVLGWSIPREFGGAGLDPLSCLLAFEALGYGCTDNGLVFAVNNHVWACVSYLLGYGTGEQQACFLPGMADGSLVGAQALTEPESGSDVLSLSTIARPIPEGYVLDGVKTFISNAPCADLFVLFARTGDGPDPQQAISAFLVPAGTPGVRVSRVWDKAGLRGAPMGEVELDGVVLDRRHLLGGEGHGYQVFTSTIEGERGGMFASAVGALRRIVETATDYANTRRQFGRPIGSFQAVSHKLADMRVRLELSRLMLYRYGWLKQHRKLALLESSILKLYVSEGLVASALDAMQIHGARGYLADFGMEREVRDALATTLYAGTSEIHRSVIARLTGVVDDC